MKHLFTFFLAVLLSWSASAQVSFDIIPSSPCTPTDVKFINTSNVGSSYEWFIEGESHSGDAVLLNMNPGYYFVELAAFDTFGGFIGNHMEEIELKGVNIYYLPFNDKVCVGELITPTAESNGFRDSDPVSNHSWDFWTAPLFLIRNLSMLMPVQVLIPYLSVGIRIPAVQFL